jgi:hypothetical protein
MSHYPRWIEFPEVYSLVGLGCLAFNALAHSSHEKFPIAQDDRAVLRGIRDLDEAEKEREGPLDPDQIAQIRAAKPTVLRVARAWLKQTKQDASGSLKRLCDEMENFQS